MTACVNRKHTKKVAAVVTASLVGALSLGVAPVAAVADTGIETLAAEWFTGATVTKATDGKGAAVSNPEAAVFTVGSGKYLKPIELVNTMGDVTPVDTDEYVYEYYKGSTKVADSTGNPTTVSNYFKNTANAGTYSVKIVKKTDSTEAAGNFYFKLANKASEVTYSFFDAINGSSDTTFTYTGGAWITTSYTGNVGVVDSNGDTHAISSIDDIRTPDGTSVSEAKNAGNYVVTVTVAGIGQINIDFTIEKLDLSKAAITIDDTTAGYANGAALISAIKVEGRTPAAGIIKVSSVDGPGSYGFTSKGVYTATLASNGDSNVTGTGTVSFAVLHKDVFNDWSYTVNYGRNSINPTDGLTFWLEDGESFDISKVSVVSPDKKTVYSGDQLEIILSDDKGEKVDASALASAGDYTMTVRVKATESFKDGWIGGTSVAYGIDVTGTELSTAENLGFYIDGKVASESDHLTYDGTDQLGRLTVKVVAGGKALVEGTDYTVEVKKDKKVVEEAVDAGTYTVTVKPLTFEFTDTSADMDFDLTIDPVTVQYLYPNVDGLVYNDNGSVNDGDSDFGVAYTGSAIEIPGALYEINHGNGKYGYAELPSDVYNVVSIKDESGKLVREITDKGEYTVKVALSDGAKGNYSLTGTGEFTFEVREFGYFTDVDSSAWYAVPVEKAADLGYVHGISGTNLFAPEADITRADAVCILFNMAGGESMPEEDFSFDVNTGYNTGFSDVDGHSYFAKALAWARAFGVANGYGDGTFAPFAQITREEFASMLANYAKAMGKFEAADESALDSMSDANTVSDWAEANVAWAVENGVMGNGGFVAGQSNITRAEVAAMAVNYQPEALEK